MKKAGKKPKSIDEDEKVSGRMRMNDYYDLADNIQAKLKQAIQMGDKARMQELNKQRDELDAHVKKHGMVPENVAEEWSQKYKSSINCSHPKGFSQKAHCAGKKKHTESVEMEMVCEDCGMCETHGDHSQQSLGEACWKGYHKEGMKTMFGKRYPNCVKNKNESLETYIKRGECPGCGDTMVAEGQLNEKQDACYHKVKSRYKVWPSAYASGALVQCRKKGAANWGNSNESITQEEYDQLDENLKKWFSDKWVRFGPDGKIKGDCARGDDSEGKPKCLPQSQAHSLGKKGRASAAARKRREDPNPERSGKAINVATKEGVAEAERNFPGANGPVSVTTTPGSTVVKRKSWDSGAGGSPSDRIEFRDPNYEYFNSTRNSDYDSGDYSDDSEISADWPFEALNELSNEKLTQYKRAAAADAGKSDLEGNFKRADKRFGGIVQATKKQFANDVKKSQPQ